MSWLDAHAMSNTFVKAFASVYADEVLPSPPHQEGPGTILTVEFSIPLVKKLSAMGPDNLHSFLLK